MLGSIHGNEIQILKSSQLKGALKQTKQHYEFCWEESGNIPKSNPRDNTHLKNKCRRTKKEQANKVFYIWSNF